MEYWKYLNNDGTYLAHTWQWIDGNSARFEDTQGTRLIGFSINDYRNQADYFRTAEGTTDASFQDGNADAVQTTLKATVVLRDTKEYRSGPWSHVQLTGYVGDYQKHWSNVHCFFQSNDFVLTTVRICSTGAEMDVDGFMNSLVKNRDYDSVR